MKSKMPGPNGFWPGTHQGVVFTNDKNEDPVVGQVIKVEVTADIHCSDARGEGRAGSAHSRIISGTSWEN